MQAHLEIIRSATASDATDETRAAGAAACRAILTALEPAPTQALAPLQAMPQLVAMLGKMDLNQLLDVAIERLRAVNAANPSPTPTDPPRAMAIPLVPIPSTLRNGR